MATLGGSDCDQAHFAVSSSAGGGVILLCNTQIDAASKHLSRVKAPPEVAHHLQQPQCTAAQPTSRQ